MTEPRREPGLAAAFIDSLMSRIYKDGQGEPMRTSMDPEEVEQALRAIVAAGQAEAAQAARAEIADDGQCPERCLGIIGHLGPHQTSDYVPPSGLRRPYTVAIGMDALVKRADGSSINFGDAIYHPGNADEARAYARLIEGGPDDR